MRNVIAILLLSVLPTGARAQFYQGTQQEYGKNRVQFQEFFWQQYRFQNMEVYFYTDGRDIARFTAQAAQRHLAELQNAFDFAIDERLQFIVYNSLTDFRQSNIGLEGMTDQTNIGGLTRIVGTKIFVYFEGDHSLLDQQIRSGIAHVIIDQMMFGGNWREILRSSTFLSLPDWYTQGIISYHGRRWDAATANRVRDAVMSGRYDKFNRLEGEDARMAGHMLWRYVAEVYGPAVIPNILYMTRVSRNAESGFLYVLGVSLKTLISECLEHYRSRFGEEDRYRQEYSLEQIPIRTKRQRHYAQLQQSPDGRWLAWTSNEMGQYKVWLREIATGKTSRIIKGEKKIDRIIDRSYPVLAWHPSSKALSYVVERKGELRFRTYTLDDRKTSERDMLLLEKVLSMDYAPDGRTMVLSGVRAGRTDLYLFNVLANRSDPLTDDPWDDLEPRFVDGGRRVIFSSDRTDDTLRVMKDIVAKRGHKDLFLLDMERRWSVLTRLTATPGISESQPFQLDSTGYTYLSDEDGVANRFRVRYDSTISHIDTTIHYRYFTVEERLTDLKRGLLEQFVRSDRGRLTALQLSGGKYRFYQGRVNESGRMSAFGLPIDTAAAQRRGTSQALADEQGAVVKVKPQHPRGEGEGGFDVRRYVFSDEVPGAQAPNMPQAQSKPRPAEAQPDSAQKAFAYPEQRNYNLNFTIDRVVTQVDNSYSNQFYQPFTGQAGINPGLSGLTRMAAHDLFEDHRVVGGFRLALDLNNNDYLLAYENLKHRLDKRISFQRQAFQGLNRDGIVKVHSHNVRYQLSWPFSELASVRASIMYRHDRFVQQSIDPLSLATPNEVDHMAGAKLEWIYDSSMPRGLNLWTGWKLKVFGEYYQHPERKGDMQVLGTDLRHSMRLHRDLIWVSRIAGASSLGSRRILHFLGGVDNWMFARFDPSIPIDFTQNYQYQTLSTPMRGFFYNARNGTSFAVINNEARVPIFRYLLNRPIRSDFINHMQVAVFSDIGSAWTGSDPYAEDNSFNRLVIQRNPLTITLNSTREPILASYGFGLRTRLLGYFVRADWAWGIDDGVRLPRVFHFSLSLDI
ncbi:MAG: PD40 domain-containing protein [Flavobacteriales bacterium]|nr:PD40 domain-containing protein [Flavobacteriales bacterium]